MASKKTKSKRGDAYRRKKEWKRRAARKGDPRKSAPRG